MKRCAKTSNSKVLDIQGHLDALVRAIVNGCSMKWKLRLWSKFIRFRDGQCCVNCGVADRVQAHHIIRKVSYPHGALQTGNGISLCWSCHKKIHAEFNRRPNLMLPLGAEQGDDQDEWSYLFGLLKDDAKKRGILESEFYFMDDHMLNFFVQVQGYEKLLELVTLGSLSRIQFAHEIWRNMPEIFYSSFMSELVRVNLQSASDS